MKTSEIEWYLRRDYKQPKRAIAGTILMFLIIVLVFLLSLFVHVQIEPKIPQAHAAEMIQDIHTRAAACSYFELYPEKIADMKQYKKNCT